MIFAAMSFYWAAGGELGLSTLAEVIQDQAAEGDTTMFWSTLLTGVVKVIGGMLALATVQPWGRAIPKRALLWLIRAGGVLLTLYGVAGLIEKLLMVTCVMDIPESIGRGPVWWYLFFWEPWWILGGVLFLMTARAFQTRHISPS
jgi:hypothetical protein